MKYATTSISVLAGALLLITASGPTAAQAPEQYRPAIAVSHDATLVVASKTKKKKWSCKNVLAQRLHASGFRGSNLREAWAIAMRESGGNPKSISTTGDYGVFQFNRGAHYSQPWWNSQKLLTPKYNINVAYRMSRGGKTWYMWDISGKGQHLGRYTSSGTFATYKKWYDKYPCAA